MACDPEQVYLTHYSRVRNLDRLAAQMHDGIDAYVRMAREHEHDDNRSAALRASLLDYYEQRLSEHGYSGDRDLIQSVLGVDVDLNAQGLEVWLHREK